MESLVAYDIVPVTQIQILNETVRILHKANNIRKGMNSAILPLAIGK